jgi:hypothetical protein
MRDSVLRGREEFKSHSPIMQEITINREAVFQFRARPHQLMNKERHKGKERVEVQFVGVKKIFRGSRKVGSAMKTFE